MYNIGHFFLHWCRSSVYFQLNFKKYIYCTMPLLGQLKCYIGVSKRPGYSGLSQPFLDRVRGPYKLGKLLTFWGNWEIFHIFKMKNKTDIFFWYTVIFKIQCSLPRWEVLIFLIALENCSSNSLLKSNCKHNWEFFNIKFRKYISICHWESWFQPQFVGSDGPDLHRVTRFDLILHNLIFGTTISSQFFYRNQLTLRRTLSYLNHQLFLQKPRLIL